MLLRQLHLEIGESLKLAGIEQPRREAALILAHLLGLTRAGVYTEAEKPVDPERAGMIHELARRRAAHEPLAYLLGETEFAGLTFEVGPGVLIPRPDSEILVETGLAACDRLTGNPLRILDICTGTGCVGISLVGQLRQKGKPVLLWLTDVDPTAADYARRNLLRHQLADGGKLEIADLWPADPGLRWDLIVANPPYIASPVMETLMPEVRCHEPVTALDGGPDGLLFYRRLIAGAAARLNPGGCLLLEHGYDQAEAVAGLIQDNGCYHLISAIRDYGGQPRVSGGWLK